MSAYFKRKESFRYKFPEPYLMEIRTLSEEEFENEEENEELFSGYVGHLENLSPNGLCFTSEESFRLFSKLQFDFDLGNVRCSFIGKVIWQKDFGMKKQYGVIGENEKELQKLVIQGLKEYVQLKR